MLNLKAGTTPFSGKMQTENLAKLGSHNGVDLRYIQPQFRGIERGCQGGGEYNKQLYEAKLNSLWTFSFPLAVFQKLCLVPA